MVLLFLNHSILMLEKRADPKLLENKRLKKWLQKRKF